MSNTRKTYHEKSWYWLFLAPCLISLLLVVIIPFMIGIYYSMTDWNGINKPNFKYLENFYLLLSDNQFWNSLLFTAKFSVVFVLIINIIGLGLALLVTRELPTRNFMRTAFYMPNLIGGLILGFIWNFVFVDVFDSIGDMTGIMFFKGWLSTTNTGFWGLVIITAWQMAGYIMVIYIAFIEGVPTELIEASEIDGASSWQKLKKIIFPLIFPAFTISLFITLSNSFKLFDQNLTLTQGAPGNTTQMIALNIYQTAYQENNMALGQAKAVLLFLIIAVISIIQIYNSKKKEVEQ